MDRVSPMRVTSTPGRCILAGPALKGDTLCRLASLSAGYPLKRETFDHPSSRSILQNRLVESETVESKRGQRDIIDVGFIKDFEKLMTREGEK